MKGARELLCRLRRQAADLSPAAQAAADEAARRTAQRARDAAPVRTGALRASIAAGDGLVTADRPYASAVQQKTGFLSRSASGEEYAALAAETVRKEILK